MRAYKANMIPGGVTPTINVSQYDNDYAVTVTLIEGAEIYTPPVGATIRVEGTKPDGHGFEYPCTYQGNVVTMPIYTQMTAVSGRFPIELVVYQSGLRVGSCNIVFAVEKAPLGEDTDISETVIPDIIDAAQASAEAAQEAAETAQEAAAEVLSSQIVTSASGSIATFADGADDVAVKSLVAEITPVQSGSGDPSPTNIRPISGRTGLTVTRAGKNLLNWETTSKTINGVTFTVNSDGTVKADGTATADASLYATASTNTWLKAGAYVINGCPSGGSITTYEINETSKGAHDTGGGATFTMPDDGYVRVRIVIRNGYTANNLLFKPMIRPASISDDTFVPYAGTTIPITWETEAGTVYGGTLDVVSGVLTVDKALVTFNGVGVTWGKYTPNSGNYCFRTDIRDMVVGLIPMYANRYKALTDFAYKTSDYGVFSGHTLLAQMYFRPPDASVVEVADWNAWLAANNLQVVYPLATPQTYQLTPTEVRTLLGGNTIYTDAGDVSVEYIADTKLYIDNKIAELQALVLEN